MFKIYSSMPTNTHVVFWYGFYCDYPDRNSVNVQKHLSKNADSIKLVRERQFPVPDTQVTADHGGYKFIAYVLTILPHILSLRKDSQNICDKLIATVVCREYSLKFLFAEAMTNRSQIGAGEQQLGTTKQTVSQLEVCYFLPMQLACSLGTLGVRLTPRMTLFAPSTARVTRMAP